MYKSGAIHVDVRAGTNSIWSNSYGADSVGNLTNTDAQNVLYGFASGQCTGGSIATDYGEEKIYGSHVEYDIPESFTNPNYRIPSLGGGTSNASWTPSDNGVGDLTDFSTVFDEIDYGTTPTETSFGSILSNFFSTRSTSQEGDTLVAYMPIGEGSGDVTCEGSGLFGMTLFNTCGTTLDTTATLDTTVSNTTNERTPSVLSTIGKTLGLGSTSTYNQGGNQAIFVAYHTPTDAAQYTDEYGRTAFVSGDAVDVATGNMLLQDATHIGAQSVRYGAYFGFVHGFSPIVIGSAPSAMVRLSGQALGAFVNN